MHPSPFQWLRYAYTGSLPRRLDAWVLHDVTCPTWLLRHAARFLAYLAPLMVLVLVLLPAPLPIRLACVLVGILGSAALSFGYIVEGAERRVEKAGYEYGLAARIREQRAVEHQRASAARHRQRVAARQARRAAR